MQCHGIWFNTSRRVCANNTIPERTWKRPNSTVEKCQRIRHVFIIAPRSKPNSKFYFAILRQLSSKMTKFVSGTATSTQQPDLFRLVMVTFVKSYGISNNNLIPSCIYVWKNFAVHLMDLDEKSAPWFDYKIRAIEIGQRYTVRFQSL